MADPKLLDVDPLTGKRMWYQFDKDDHRESKDAHTITSVTDIEPILAANAEERKFDSYSGKKFGGTEMRRVASIPWSVFVELEKRGIATAAGRILDQNAFNRWLSSSEALPYRTIQNVSL